MEKQEEQELIRLLNTTNGLTEEQRKFFQTTMDIMNDNQKEILLNTLKSYDNETEKLEKKILTGN